MTRVSENSNKAALNFALNKAKSKLENLQLKGGSLKNVTKPSDNPIGNAEALQIDTVTSNNKQFLKNSDYALFNLNIMEKSLEDLSNILMKAKEITIAQSSDLSNATARKNVSQEIKQLYDQSLNIANKKIGNRYVFSGYATTNKPFNTDGTYNGDKGEIKIEISKENFIPVNIPGEKLFIIEDSPQKEDKIENNGRDLASVNTSTVPDSVFLQLSTLNTALESNDTDKIQGLIDRFDSSISKLITERTKIGAISNTVMNAKNQIESENVENASYKSKLVDADVGELFSDIAKQQQILQNAYKSGQVTLNRNLLDFLR
ncbi:MAG: flagellar hook-associated protein FlgL [Bdellovibrionales bacterium]|jgi:flagellar hook-associated protein 3 FlgL|nr:flagellar hook-associated protein FlgL [Bdellovibrionales bacterium]